MNSRQPEIGAELERTVPADLPKLPPRKPDSHKGDYGRALLVGGSRGMAGAIGLAGLATLRSGAGLVRLAIADVCLDTVAAYEPSYMTSPLPADDEGRIDAAALPVVERLAEPYTCIACGPGLGRAEGLTKLVQHIYRSIDRPAVFDADALNALSSTDRGFADPAGPRILTPHPGEFRRMLGGRASDDLASSAIEMAAKHGLVIVLKGHRTLITDGRESFHNDTGNPGMATGGSGDILTGVITALVCQGLSALDAARLGVYVHGLAGDLAAEAIGQVSVIARDLADFLPAAFRRLAADSQPR